MTSTPLLERPPAPPRPPDRRERAARRWAILGAFLGVVIAAVVLVVAFATDVFDEQAPVVPAPADVDGGEPAQEPAEEPAEEPAAPPRIRYDEELRANWMVVGVAADDVLNVRSGPGTTFRVIGSLELTSPELESTGRIAYVGAAETLWREIVVPGDGVGWVNATFLGEIPPPQVDVRYREELRANWDVTGVAADDVLNVRALPGVSGKIVATLEPDTVELESTGRIADVGPSLWREIVVPGDGVGWVNAAYLTETR